VTPLSSSMEPLHAYAKLFIHGLRITWQQSQ
jgi:hypothetical protein